MGCGPVRYDKNGKPVYKPITPWKGSWAQLEEVRSCVVSSSLIAKNHGILSPSYYLTLDIKRVMMDMIDAAHAETLVDKMESIIQSGTIKLPGRNYEKVPPEFVSALKTIWR